MRLDGEARGDGSSDAGVGLDLGGVEVELLPQTKPGCEAQVDDLLEEAAEDVEAVALPDPGQAGVVGSGSSRA